MLQLAKEIRKLASASGTADKKVLDLPDVLDMAVKLTSHVLASPDISVDRRYTVTPYVEASEAQLTQIFVEPALERGLRDRRGADRRAAHRRVDADGRGRARGRRDSRLPVEGSPRKGMPRLFDPFFTTKPAGARTRPRPCRYARGSSRPLRRRDRRARASWVGGATFRVVLLPVAPRREPASSSENARPGRAPQSRAGRRRRAGDGRGGRARARGGIRRHHRE